jgi:prepilin signal peptidase PulO-like enzyme (type II secretory pathway)
MNAFFIFFGAIFGAIVGSFLNVVVARLHTGMTLSGRSCCFSCRTQLRWYELIPVLSFVLQSGRCRTCDARISHAYVVGEIVTALAFGGIAFVYGPLVVQDSFVGVTAAFLFLVFALLIALSLYDVRHTIIPDVLMVPVIILSGVSLFFVDYTSEIFLIGRTFHAPSLWGALAGVLIPLPFALLWLVSHGRLMGFGDIKLMVAMGWLLGLLSGINAVVLSFWIALGVIVLIHASQRLFRLFPRTKRFIMSSEIPFAPFLVIGLYLVLIFGVHIMMTPFV